MVMAPAQIGVVGAGMAGLRCAEVLLRRGYRVVVLEGRSRIGGRIHQVEQHDGRLVDMGPNWIHGTESNPILDIAKATKSTLHAWEENQTVFDHLGKPLPKNEAAECAEFLWSNIIKAFAYSKENADDISPDASLLDFLKERLAEEKPQKQNVSDDQLLWMSHLWGAYVGEPIDRQSLKYFWLEECIDGENLFLASTYKAVLDHVAALPMAEKAVQLSKKVVKISSAQDSQRVDVEIADGEVLRFDHVVVTAPLGWLKHNKSTAFQPSLPPPLWDAIDAIGYGRLEKVYLTFPKAFWAGNEDDPAFFHWTHPTYASETNAKYWNQEAVNLALLPSETRQPTLLYYVFGPNSEDLVSILTRTPQSDHRQALTEYFKPYFSRLPNYDDASLDCFPIAATATSWSADEFAGYGSYCNFPTGLTYADRHIKTMRHGMPERHVWFAGEHTAPFVALGTTTGAFWSGEAVAKRIIEQYETVA